MSILSSVSASEVLRLGIAKEGYPPYILIEDDHIHGIMIEVLERAVAFSGYELSYHFLPEVRSKNMLDRHEIDLRMESPSFVDDPDKYLWTEPITSIKDMFIYHRLSENVFEDDETMNGAVIHTHLGYSYPTLQPMFDKGEMIRKDFNSEKSMLVNLTRDNIHSKRAAVMDKNVAKYLMEKDSELKSNLKI